MPPRVSPIRLRFLRKIREHQVHVTGTSAWKLRSPKSRPRSTLWELKFADLEGNIATLEAKFGKNEEDIGSEIASLRAMMTEAQVELARLNGEMMRFKDGGI
jgi:hypothetical protein